MATANDVKNIIKSLVSLYNQFATEVAISETVGGDSELVKSMISSTKELRDDALDTIKKYIKNYDMTFEDIIKYDEYVGTIWINNSLVMYKYNRIKMI